MLLTFVCTTTTLAKPQEGYENTFLNWGGYQDNVAREDTYGKHNKFLIGTYYILKVHAGYFYFFLSRN